MLIFNLLLVRLADTSELQHILSSLPERVFIGLFFPKNGLVLM